MSNRAVSVHGELTGHFGGDFREDMGRLALGQRPPGQTR